MKVEWGARQIGIKIATQKTHKTCCFSSLSSEDQKNKERKRKLESTHACASVCGCMAEISVIPASAKAIILLLR